MITVEQFRERASVIYSGQRDRHKRKLLKGIPKGVTLDIDSDDILPYTRQEFSKWLWDQVGLQAVRCPYCGAIMDALSLVIDHRVPIKLGGSVDLANQEPICKDCNLAKGALTPEQFTALLAFVGTLGPTGAADVLSRLRMGSGYLRTAFIGRKQKQSQEPSSHPAVRGTRKPKQAAMNWF